jgi:chemotaxis protein MotA
VDIASLGGLLVAIGMIAFGAMEEHVVLKSLVGLSAFAIVIGGSIGATIISHTMEDLKLLPRMLKIVFFPPKIDFAGTADGLVTLAEKARRQGILSLQADVESAANPIIKRGLTLAVDGSDPDNVQDVLESMGDEETAELKHGAAVFETAGGYSPTLGIMGTVMGLITVMGKLDQPDTLGPSIATAFLATLYGVAFANLVFLPFGAKVKGAAARFAKYNEMIILGINGIQSGENPRFLREKLMVYVGNHSKHKSGKEKAQTADSAAPAEGGA